MIDVVYFLMGELFGSALNGGFSVSFAVRSYVMRTQRGFELNHQDALLFY
jgi:hypothetical protein